MSIDMDLSSIPRKLDTKDQHLRHSRLSDVEGMFRNLWLLDNEWADSVMLGLVKPD